MSNPTPTPAALREAVEGLQRVLDYHDHLIRHKGIMGQMLPCCQSHIDLDLARSALHFLALPLDPGEAPAPDALAAIEKAEAEVDRLNKEFWGSGKVSWRVSIPVERSRDSDFLLSDALCKARSALKAGTPSPQGLGEARTPREVEATLVAAVMGSIGRVLAENRHLETTAHEVIRLVRKADSLAAAPSPAPAPTTRKESHAE